LIEILTDVFLSTACYGSLFWVTIPLEVVLTIGQMTFKSQARCSIDISLFLRRWMQNKIGCE